MSKIILYYTNNFAHAHLRAHYQRYYRGGIFLFLGMIELIMKEACFPIYSNLFQDIPKIFIYGRNALPLHQF